MKYSNTGFTLIEVLVSVSILSIVMVSIFTIFFISNDINNKTDISRAMQENIKHIVETLAEDVRKNTIVGLEQTELGGCRKDFVVGSSVIQGNKICVGDNEYYLAKKQGENYMRELDVTHCKDINNACIFVKNGQPVSNSWVEFENLEFLIMQGNPEKIQINFTLRPSSKKGVKIGLIEQNRIIFQTTLSKRIY